MTYPRAVLTAWLLAILLACALAYDMAQAGEKKADTGIFLDVAGGMTNFLVTSADGDYRQGSLPHAFDTRSAAYRAELGWRFNKRWAIQAGYVNLGTLNQSAIFVPDENYDPKTAACLNGCTRRKNYRITDAYHGGELTLTRSFGFDDWSLFLKAGGAYLMHRFTMNLEDGSGNFSQHYGRFPATVAGAGVSYKWAYFETNWIHGIGGSNGFMGQDQGWPLSKEMLVMWFGFRIPIGG
jgi:hypothetical protein